MATPTLIAAYQVNSPARDTSNLTTASFTPANGEVLVVKAANENIDGPTIGLASGGSLTYTSRASISQANRASARLFTAVVSGSPGSMTVTVAFSGNIGMHSMIVERWGNAQLAGSPAVASGIYDGAPQFDIVTVAGGSIVSWVSADWNAITPSPLTYRSNAVQTGMDDQSGGFYVAYYAYQNTDTAGTQTFGLSSPGGQAASMIGIEIQGVTEIVQFDRLGPNAGGGAATGTSVDWPHTTTGQNRLLLVGSSLGSSPPDTGKTLAATYNGVSMTSLTLVHTNNQNAGFVQLFYMVNPPVGTYTVQITASSSVDILGGSLSFIGVNQSTPTSGLVTSFGEGTSASIDVTSKAGDMVVTTVANGSDITSSSQTLRWNQTYNQATGAGNAAQSTAAGASSVNTTYTVLNDWWGIIGINLIASGTSAPGNPTATVAWLAV